MIALSSFRNLARNLLDRRLDDAQNPAVSAPLGAPLFLVACPGSGKTTVLGLRVLRLIFIDGVNPVAVLATTFVRYLE